MLIVTNKANSVFRAIEAIAATPSKSEKEALVKLAGQSSLLFMKVVKAAYHPLITYGVAVVPHKTPDLAPGANTLEEEAPWKVIEQLASRELTGNAARAAIQRWVDFLDDASSELFRRILLKDMRAGFTDGTINRVFPGTLPEFPYMRCSLPAKSNMDKWVWADGIISQEKADGMFANINITADGFVSLHSRQGSAFPLANMGGLGDALKASLKWGTQSHGEMVVLEGGKLLPREIGNGILNHIQQGGALEPGCRIVMYVWDQIPLDQVKPKGKVETPYEKRLMDLLSQLPKRETYPQVQLIPTLLVKSRAAANDHYRELLARGREGTILKARNAIWKDGTSKDQVKLKLEAEVELKIVGFVPGTPGTKTEATFGSLLLQSECGELEVACSGLTDAKRQAIHNDREGWMSKVITVRANAIMEPSGEGQKHSLFLPRFVEEREDKLRADDLAKVKAIFQAAVEAA